MDRMFLGTNLRAGAGACLGVGEWLIDKATKHTPHYDSRTVDSSLLDVTPT